MKNEELKEALMSGREVKHKGITYRCISAIIYRNNNGKIVVYVELMDKNNNSVSIVEPNNIERVT